jgi:hypothetical protein
MPRIEIFWEKIQIHQNLRGVVFREQGHVALVRNDVSEESIVFIIRLKRISELGKTLTVSASVANHC